MSNPEKGWAFIDTNVWFYAFTGKDPEKHQIAVEAIRRFREFILVSTQVINELCLNLKKKVDFPERREDSLDYEFSRSSGNPL